MKKCQQCPKPATLHITEIREGEAQAIHLCENCAQKYLSNVDVGSPSSSESPTAEIDAESGSAEETPSPTDDKACPVCQITFKQFRSIGRLGCPHCYDAFHDELLPLLESIHNHETQHVGKSPARSSEENKQRHNLGRLRADLREAIENEQYELAARIRDQIQAIEKSADQPAR
jgi:protein arginine kinase activator